MRFLGRMITIFLAISGAVGFLLTAGAIGFAVFLSAPPSLPKKGVLKLDLDRPVGTASTHPFSALMGKVDSYDLNTLITAIDRAAADPRITALTATVNAPSMALASVQEVREAVIRFRHSGKPAIVFSESFGDGENGTLAYYLASAFGEIWLQPSGTLTLNGFAAEAPFIHDFLEKIGIKGEFSGRHEYKGAIETFTRSSMSDEQRANVERLLQSWTEQVVRDIVVSRKVEAETVHRMIAASPALAPEGLRSGLVDSLGYGGDAFKAVLADKPILLEADRYAAAIEREAGEKERTSVALIRAEGEIVAGESRSFSVQGRRPLLGSHTIARALLDAGDDPDVKAVIFYIDSPGGSYVASDTIHDAVSRVMAAGKPVIAVMGGSAASGGYFSVMGATKVVAQPGTVTGSIGVFGGKFSLAELWSKLGVSWDGVQVGESAGRWSPNRDFSAAEWAKLNVMLDAIYADFTQKAATDRNLSPEQIDQAARGRIWSGEDALELGLIDHLGGLMSAQRILKKELNLSDDTALDIRLFPAPKSRMQQLLEMSQGNFAASLPIDDRLMQAFFKVFGPLLESDAGPMTKASLPEWR